MFSLHSEHFLFFKNQQIKKTKKFKIQAYLNDLNE